MTTENNSVNENSLPAELKTVREGGNYNTESRTSRPDNLARNLLIVRLFQVLAIAAIAATWVFLRIDASSDVTDKDAAKYVAQSDASSEYRTADDARKSASVEQYSSNSSVESKKFAADYYIEAQRKSDAAQTKASDAAAQASAAQSFSLKLWYSLVIIIPLLLAIFFIFRLVIRHLKEEDIRRKKITEAFEGLEQAQNTETTEFLTLWKSNKSQLLNYHKLVLDHANASRQLTRFTLIGGAIFLLLLGILTVLTNSTAAAISSSVLAAMGTLTTGYVSRAVLRNAESSSSELGAFFTHPLEVERALAAERIILSMPPAEQSSAKLLIIRYLTGIHHDNDSSAEPVITPEDPE